MRSDARKRAVEETLALLDGTEATAVSVMTGLDAEEIAADNFADWVRQGWVS